ncbi:hypothetical protein CUJ83_07405 [Methanocella sp. CWC-04]|uniref:DUF2207 domain-containing protein n=2 Tax=Methanooceanicella nereidis TaxID=2052831 RepID=A0AAP2W730_9EURY|nr:hypothetical protein [Methanocella sp. CWC-04]
MSSDFKKALCITFIAIIILSMTPVASAEEYRWQVNNQHVLLDVNTTGVVYMEYRIDADIVKGVWNEVWIPLTTSNQKVYYVEDGSSKRHDFRVEGGQIKIQDFNLRPGDNVKLNIYSSLYPFVYQADREGYDIVTFIPVWWDMYIDDTRVKIYLPEGVSKDEVLTGKREYDNTMIENGQLAVYFEEKNLAPNQKFEVAVAFPDKYMQPGAVFGKAEPTAEPYFPGVTPFFFEDVCGCICPMLFFFGIFMIIIFAGASTKRNPYSSPVVKMDGIGVNKELDPAEAATLLRIDPKRVLTIIMFQLMKKGNIKLISTDPIRLELVSKKGLKYYEKLFVESIVDDRLDEAKLLECFKVIARRVVDKTRPYCRRDTEVYYRQKIYTAWDEIKAVETPELKLEKYDSNMMWLLADEEFKEKTKEYVSDAPGSDTYRVPPYYWWYPYYWGLPRPYEYRVPTRGEEAAKPVPTPTPEVPRPTDRTTATVENFANSISNSVESFSAGVVANVERFIGVRKEANAPPPTSNIRGSYAAPTGRTSCACVSCACACVSCACACACAGGGGGCT